MGPVVEKVRDSSTVLSPEHARIIQRSLRIRGGAACAAANREIQYAFVPRLCTRIKTLCNSSVLIIPCSRGAANV